MAIFSVSTKYKGCLREPNGSLDNPLAVFF